MTTPEAPPQSSLILYQTEDGQTRIQCRLVNDTIWLTQALMAELFQVAAQTVSEHLKSIYEEGEIQLEATNRKFRIVRQEGVRRVTREIDHYSLPAILAVGFRVRSQRGTQFRQWATARLEEYMVKGFTMDDERLKNPPGPGVPDYFDDLLERIRDIRASERRVYLRVRDILALAADYAPKEVETQSVFQIVQNKLHFAATGMTAPELIAARAHAAQPNMGLTSWKEGTVRKADAPMACSHCGGADHNIQTCCSVRRCGQCGGRRHDRRNCSAALQARQPLRDEPPCPRTSGDRGPEGTRAPPRKAGAREPKCGVRAVLHRDGGAYDRGVAVSRFIATALVLLACSPHRGPDFESLPEEPRPIAAPLPEEPIAAPPPIAAPIAVVAAPVPAARASEAIAALAAGVHHTCALRGGQVFCWGLNRQGILGVDEPGRGDILQPRLVVGLPVIVQVDADYDFTCALAEDHSVYCWGANDRGQLGVGDTVLRSTPTRLAELAADRLFVGFERACAGRGRDILCWGTGELGDGGERRRLVPLEIAALAGIERLALAGGHACTLRAGKVGCWGHNGSGQLGNGEGGCRDEYPRSPQGRRLPPRECKHEARRVGAVGLPPIVALALGGDFSYALDGDGKVWRWGQQGVTMDYGENLDKYRPHGIDGLPAMVELAAGNSHACARTAAGALWCWGNNSFGQLGHAPVPGGSGEAPARVDGLPPVRALAPGFYYTCVLAGEGAELGAWCWGDNGNGQLGDGVGERRHAPVEVRWD